MWRLSRVLRETRIRFENRFDYPHLVQAKQKFEGLLKDTGFQALQNDILTL